MKYILSIAVFFSFYIQGNGQSKEWEFFTQVRGNILGVIELNNGDVVACGYEALPVGNGLERNFNRIWRFSKDGMLKKNYEFTDSSLTLALFYNKDKNLVIGLTTKREANDSVYVVITTWDEDMNVLKERSIGVGKRWVWRYTGSWVDDEILLIGIIGYNEPKPPESISLRLDETGDIIQYKINSDMKWKIFPYYLVPSLDGSGYISGGFYIRKFDDSLNLDTSYRNDLRLVGPERFHLFPWSDSSYLAGASTYPSDPQGGPKNLSIYELNKDLEPIKIVRFYPDGYFDFSADIKCIGWLSKDNIYFFGGFASPTYNSDGKLFLFNLDENLNVRWEQEYIIKNGFWADFLCPTQDGGVLLTGKVHESYAQYQGMLVKISNNALAVEDPLPKDKKGLLTLYPNPSNGGIWVDIHGVSHAEMSILDTQGNVLVKKSDLQEGVNQFNFDFLPPGAYQVMVAHAGVIIGEQTWIKL